MKKKILIVAGPTAVGKTEYAIDTALEFSGEILSADSMQIYKYMDIGSAKPSQAELAAVKHHFIDEVDPREPFSVAEYRKRAGTYLAEIFQKEKLPVVCGGTGLYVNSLIYEMDFSQVSVQDDFRRELEREAEAFGNQYVHSKLKQLDPDAAERIHPNNLKKVIRALEVVRQGGKGIPEFNRASVKSKEYDVILIGLTRDRQELYDRIDRRVDQLMEQGLVDEIRSLMDMGLTDANISMKGIGYKELIGAMNGLYDMAEAVRLIKRNTRHYAKRQLTWFRRYEEMEWFDLSRFASKKEALTEIYSYVRRQLKS